MRNQSKKWLLLITLGAILIRLPYWDVIPSSYDEVNQTVHSLLIAQGKSFPLVGNDAYTGPFYFYLLAGLLRLGITNPMLGRIVIMITGILTVPATYGWVRTISNNKIAGLIAALIVALNPDLILVNSHIGGATFLLPFFTTLFFLGLVLAVHRDNFWWLMVGAISAGIALHSNPVAGLAIIGGYLWLLWQTYRYPKSQTRSWRPFWPIYAGFIILFIYSPVIVYNLTTRFDTVDVLQERSYLWEDNPTFDTTISNMKRLSFQTSRQVSGVVDGDEQFSTLIGIPLIYVALMIIGLVYTTYYISSLPILILTPFWIVLPYFSSHYGFISVGRFTTLLIPVWAAVIGFLLAASIDKARQTPLRKGSIFKGALAVLTLLLLFFPVNSLFQYYRTVNEAHNSGSALLEISRYAVVQNDNNPIYISTIDELSFVRGIPYVPHAAFLLGDIHHEFLPPQQIIGRLYQNPESSFLLLSDRDYEIIQNTAPLERVAIPANDEAGFWNYGLYKFEGSTPLPKPDFIIDEDDIPQEIAPLATFGGGIQLLGCNGPELSPSGNNLSLDCYWKATASMPREEYIGFVHLINSNEMTLIAQDDHTLGQGVYPLVAWQSNEVIKESYTMDISDKEISGMYQIFVGIYTWPNQIRLNVPENPDNVVQLPSVNITHPN